MSLHIDSAEPRLRFLPSANGWTVSEPEHLHCFESFVLRVLSTE